MGDEGAASSAESRKRGRDGELKRVAEVVMVLSAMAEMRGGRDPTAEERAMVAEARERLARRNRFWEEKKQAGLSLTYGSAFNLRRDLDAQILAKFQRPPGALPSSMIGFEALTGALDDFGFEDYLNVPQDSEIFRPADMHHGMEVRLGISKGPACPGFI